MAEVKSKKVTHRCRQTRHLQAIDDKIHKVYVMITGNGNPEDGMLFQLAAVKKGQEDVNKSVNDLINKYQESINAANSAKSAVEKYVAEREGYTAGTKSIKEQQDDIAQRDRSAKELRHSKVIRVLTFITVLVAALALGVNTFFNIKDRKVPEKIQTIENKVDGLGSPIVVNPRGEIVALPEGYELRMWGKDPDISDKDTI
ncbi:MAG: hypothetical protein MUC78_13850 [Bacteroidales bacterium]|jgi:hypothetical protein|nr:hypothetical protein [Bacteroidales bacterium]